MKSWIGNADQALGHWLWASAEDSTPSQVASNPSDVDTSYPSDPGDLCLTEDQGSQGLSGRLPRTKSLGIAQF